MATAMRKSVSADGSASSHVSSKNGSLRSYENDTPFSLVPAIFLPYPSPGHTTTHSPNTSSSPLSPTQKLTTILSNLDTQHETVRKNMLALVLRRADRLRDAAAAKIQRARRARMDSAEERGGGGGGEGRNRAKRREEEEMRRAVSDLAARLKAPGPRHGHDHAMKGSEFELKKDETFAMQVQTQTRRRTSMNTDTNGNSAVQDMDMDVDMNMGTDVDHVTIETETEIETEADILRVLNRDLRDLVDHAVEEMVGYAEHAGAVRGEYQRALDKRGGGVSSGGGVGRRGSTAGTDGVGAGAGAGVGAGAAAKGGILKNKTQPKPVERNVIRRKVSWDV